MSLKELAKAGVKIAQKSSKPSGPQGFVNAPGSNVREFEIIPQLPPAPRFVNQGFYLPGAREEYLERQAKRRSQQSIARLRRQWREGTPGLKQQIEVATRQRDDQFRNWRRPFPFAKWPENIGDVGYIGDPIPDKPPKGFPDPRDIPRRTWELPKPGDPENEPPTCSDDPLEQQLYSIPSCKQSHGKIQIRVSKAPFNAPGKNLRKKNRFRNGSPRSKKSSLPPTGHPRYFFGGF